MGDRRGNVALIAAICAPIMMLMVGTAIDYAYALNINQRLNQAADTAVLAAISPSIAQGGGGYPTAYANNNMKSVGLNTFAANTSTLPISVTPTVSITPNTSNGVTAYSASLTYSTSVPTFFSALVGLTSIPISGTAKSTVTPLTYIRYYILVDISQSMGLGATAADMQNLYNRLQQYGQTGCVFGCHVPESNQQYSNEDYAHYLSPNITLRIDSAGAAIDSVIQAAISNENSVTPNISIGLYTMSGYPSANVTQVFAPTTSLSQYKNVTVDLGNNYAGGQGDSDFSNQITQFTTNYLPAQGTGATASSPINYVFLITDGVVDTPGSNCTSGHCTSALQSSYCDQLKAKATVGVIYTTYLPIYNNNIPANGYHVTYAYLVQPFASTIAPNLQACASSSSYYFEASDGPAITTGMNALFASSLKTSRLTQ